MEPLDVYLEELLHFHVLKGYGVMMKGMSCWLKMNRSSFTVIRPRMISMILSVFPNSGASAEEWGGKQVKVKWGL